MKDSRLIKLLDPLDPTKIDMDAARFFKKVSNSIHQLQKDALANGKKKGGFYLLEHDGKKVWISGFDTWEEGRAAYIAIRGKLKGELRADALKKLLG